MPRTARRSYPAVMTAYFTTEQDTALRAFAKKTGREAAEIIRSAVDEYLAEGRALGDPSQKQRDARYTGARVKPLHFWRPPWGW